MTNKLYIYQSSKLVIRLPTTSFFGFYAVVVAAAAATALGT